MTAATHEGRHDAPSGGLGGRLTLGWKVIAGLAMLTAVEFIVAVLIAPRAAMGPLLIVIALYKTVLIALYFMHFKQLWRREEH